MNDREPAAGDPSPTHAERGRAQRAAPPHSRVPFPMGRKRRFTCVYGLALAYVLIHLSRGEHRLVPDELFEHFAHRRDKVWEGEYWRIISSTFLHGDYLHLLMNCFGLIYVGRHIERWLGVPRFLFCYVLSALGGAVFFQGAPGVDPGVGASGGILGLIGIYFIAVFSYRRPQGLGSRFWLFLLVMIALIYVDGFLGGAVYSMMGARGTEIAVSAHLGGFLTGVLLGQWMAYLAMHAEPGKTRRAAMATIAFLMVSTTYSLAYPVFDWAWYLWSAQVALEEGRQDEVDPLYARAWELGGDRAIAHSVRIEIEFGETQKGFDIWLDKRIENFDQWASVGFEEVYDAAAGDGDVSGSDSVLDALIERTDLELAQRRTPEVLNQAAWFRAKRGVQLEAALLYAKEAYQRDSNEAIQHTLGWIQFLLKDYATALNNLKDAAENTASPSLRLYLAVAYRDLRKDELVEDLVKSVEPYAEYLFRHEQRMLDELKASMRSG